MNRTTMAIVSNLVPKLHSFALLTSLISFMTCPSSYGASGYLGKNIAVYVTAKDTGKRLAKSEGIGFNDKLSPTKKNAKIYIDPSKTFQTVLGIGGALTDASSETFDKLPKDKQQEILRAYFDPQNGIGYTLGRTPIHSCDFFSESYTYIKDGGKKNTHFEIAHDLKYRIP